MRQFYTAVIDRPINYGYIPNLIGGDGEWQDVYIISENVSAHLEVSKEN